MAEKVANIAKNTSYFTLALILQKIISFTYFALIARALGPEDLGKYYFAISFATIFSVFIDFGLCNVLTREIPKKQDSAGQILSNSLLIKFLFSIITVIAVFFILTLGDYSDLIKTLIYFSIFCVILDSFTATFFSVSRGFHNLSYESIASILFQIIVLIFGLTVIYFDLGLVWLMGSLMSASTFNFLYSALILKFKWKINFFTGINKKFLLQLLSLAVPFALYAIFQKFYTYFDTVLLSHLASNRDVGLYQIAFKINNALQFLPMAFVASLYPAMSSYWYSNREQLSITFERAMNYLLLIVMPISFGIWCIADIIILVFKEGYADAILPLQLNMVALIFMFLNYPIGSLLNACDRQKINTLNMAATFILSLVLNIILIPKLQSVGASITVIISNFFMLILGLWQVPKIINYNRKKILIILAKTFFACSLMSIFVLAVKTHLHLILTIFLAGFIYATTIYFLRAIKTEDIKSVIFTFFKKNI